MSIVNLDEIELVDNYRERESERERERGRETDECE